MTRTVSSTTLESHHYRNSVVVGSSCGCRAVMLPWEPSLNALVSRPSQPQLVARVAACPGGACSTILILCTAH